MVLPNSREITKHTVIYGVYIQFWPTLTICPHMHTHLRSTCTYAHSSLHMHLCICTPLHMHLCTSTCAPLHMHLCTSAYAHLHMHLYTSTCAPLHLYMCTLTCEAPLPAECWSSCKAQKQFCSVLSKRIAKALTRKYYHTHANKHTCTHTLVAFWARGLQKHSQENITTSTQTSTHAHTHSCSVLSKRIASTHKKRLPHPRKQAHTHTHTLVAFWARGLQKHSQENITTSTQTSIHAHTQTLL